jgi:protein TonB
MKTIRLILVVMIAVAAIGLQSNAQNVEEEVFFKVDTLPVYPGGMEALLKDISNTVKYPDEAIKDGLTGKVYVGFIVDTNGKLTNTHIARGVDPVLDKEAFQVINQLNKTWKPGIKDGIPVNTSITLLFDFQKDKKIDVSFPIRR